MLKQYFFMALMLYSGKLISKSMMNGISLQDYANFEKDWRFVTVRYRKDTGEMRFTYANDIAWNALQSSPKSYPNGSIFAKLSYQTNEDDIFPSSVVVPIKKRRYQFMVKNSSKYKSTNGWGYALFKSDGNVYNGDIKEKTIACATCHSIVDDQGGVFSKPINIPFGQVKIHQGTNWKNKFVFKKVNLNKSYSKVIENLPNKIKIIYSLQGPLSKNYFFGTFDEIRPLLIKKLKSNPKLKAVGLITQDKKNFSIVFEGKKSQCNDGELSLSSVHTVPKTDRIIRLNFCEKI